MAALLAVACGGNEERVEIRRFDQLLFDTPPERLGQVLAEHHDAFDSPLLNIYPSDAEYMEMLQGFVADPVVRHIYAVTDSLYHDLGWLERDLGAAMHRAERLYPQIKYQRYYALVTADFENYDSRVFCHGGDMAISIDRYALEAMGDMQYFGMPTYLVNMSNRRYLLADCMAAAVRAHIKVPEGEMTFLDYAIAEGKVLYFLKQVLPNMDDTLLIRYTGEQMRWMDNHVEQVWGWLIQNDVLYSTDHTVLRNLVDEAPKTNAFGEGSAPRTGAYIGWKIVNRYMKKHSPSMDELMSDSDSRKILTESGWRP